MNAAAFVCIRVGPAPPFTVARLCPLGDLEDAAGLCEEAGSDGHADGALENGGRERRFDGTDEHDAESQVGMRNVRI